MDCLKVVLIFYVVIQSALCFDEGYFTKYQNFTLFKIKPIEINHAKILSELESNFGNQLSFWNDVRELDSDVLVMANPDAKTLLREKLESSKIPYSVAMENVQDFINDEIISNERIQSARSGFNYETFNRLSTINSWMDSLQAQYPNIVSVFNLGQSYEGRNIKALKISVPDNFGNPKAKKAIMLEGGIHSREWLSPATVIYMTYFLLSKHSSDQSVQSILNSFDFYIVPVLNPDGYEYTFTRDRMWRKTRRPINSRCVGVDPNRNWDAAWSRPGASADPCNDAYFGTAPFSEIEVRSMANFLSANRDSIVSYISIHNFMQLWMYPYGYDYKLPYDYRNLHDGATAAVNALSRVYGTRYRAGPIASVIYQASGSSIDWTYDTLKIRYSYALELRDQGYYGFIAPQSEIRPTALETFEGLKALLNFIKSRS